MKTYTTTESKRNSISEMITVLKQANPDSIVKNERGKKVSAYLDPLSLDVVIVEDDV